jgi:hypothetical protein
MKTITHEGLEYVLKSDMEQAVQSRIQKLSSRAIQAEELVQQYQDKLDSQAGELSKIEKLGSRIQELEGELETANSRYQRHTTMADYGFQDPEIRELVEWQYEKAMKGQDNKVPMSDWLKSMKEDPTQAPITLRPHLKMEATPALEGQPAQANVETAQPGQPAPQEAMEQPAILPPKTNTGTVQAPVQSGDLLKRLANEDLDFYRANRDAIRKAWMGGKK